MLADRTQFRTRRRVLISAPLMLVAAILLGGCVSSGLLSPPRGGGVATTAPPPTIDTATGQIAAVIDANFKLLTQEVGEQINALSVDQSVNNWDAWSLRLLILSPVLGYILPKMAWHRVSKWRKDNGKSIN